MPRKKQHYVDNSKLLEVMSEYREQYLIAKDNDIEPPVIPDYAGECFLKIAENLSNTYDIKRSSEDLYKIAQSPEFQLSIIEIMNNNKDIRKNG